MMGAMNFTEFFSTATDGQTPYRYQQALADHGLPDVLRVPTGSGKTAAAILPWLYRRTEGIESTRRLVIVLPQRALVEQTVDVASQWIDRLPFDVPIHLLMGGEDAGDRDWKVDPGQSRIFVGTQDMVLSRLLMRGYAERRVGWPMSFGLLHAGTQFVFDEVQLMGPGLPTSLQLQGLRELMGAALPCRSMWMSATLEPTDLHSIDFDRALSVVELDEDDHAGLLGERLAAKRTVRRIDLGDVDARGYPALLAKRIMAEHRPGTRTLVVLNTVDRAVAVQAVVRKLAGAIPVVLLHSRFRPDDRKARAELATTDPTGDGSIVISTQVLEAGVDITSETMITELAPWSSIVQRAGRCNRYAETTNAQVLWVSPPAGKTAHLPYPAEELVNSESVLVDLEGIAVTSGQLTAASQDIVEPNHPVLRRRDLRDLFDTAPDLDGSDIDVGPFIRDADDRSVFVAWRPFPMPEDARQPGRRELCPAPLSQARELLGRSHAMVLDQQSGRWRAAVGADLRPTAMIVFDAAGGGYSLETGFDVGHRQPVMPVNQNGERSDAVDTDPQSTGCPRWVPLAEHLADTEREAQQLLDALRPELTPDQLQAITMGALFHDIGKAHPTFATSLEKANVDSPAPDDTTVWAKSPSGKPLRHEPKHFRHELVSALLLLDEQTGLLAGVAETDLVVYLALAHHGKVRLAVRAFGDEPAGIVLGVEDDSCCLDAKLPHGQRLAARPISLKPTRLGVGSLTDRALALRDRPDLGPFRLAFCEAIVRSADWRASELAEKRT
jgi:CRISPR-associated endonuclease/helicase Cas3